MKIVITFLLISLTLYASKYLDNRSCSECHDTIYQEFQSSAHSKTYFNDELHRKIADHVSKEKYECAYCHMPMANNLKDLIDGKARVDKNNKTHSDAISCYFCHTIAYVKKSHRFNLNHQTRQAKNYKPTLFGTLKNPDDCDKHSSVSNPIYTKLVCIGCHSHKLNENNVTIFRAMDKNQDSRECIKCHMPKVDGGGDKINKKARLSHASHKFLGIRDKVFRKKGIDLNATFKDKKLLITLTNKMAHPLIIQPARAKFLKIQLFRDNKVIWKNYQKDPSEDKKAYFASTFKRDGKKIVIPATATSGTFNNIAAHKSKNLEYNIDLLQKGDSVKIEFFVQLAKSDCSKVIDLEDKSFMEPKLIKSLSLKR